MGPPPTIPPQPPPPPLPSPPAKIQPRNLEREHILKIPRPGIENILAGMGTGKGFIPPSFSFSSLSLSVDNDAGIYQRF